MQLHPRLHVHGPDLEWGWRPKATHDYEAFDVEVTRTQVTRTTVTVQAKNPLSAAMIVDDYSFQLPPEPDWLITGGGWQYTVREQGTRAVLYSGDAQDLA
jgi:hypothetical protein